MMDTNTEREYENAIDMFKRTDRLHQRVFCRCISSFDISRSQHRLLMFLAHHGPTVSQKDIAGEFEISSAAVAVTLKKLEKIGYIEKTVNESDSRYNTVCITQKGLDIVKLTHSTFWNIDMKMFEDLSPEELRLFSECLAKMHASLHKMYDDSVCSCDNKEG